MRGLGYAGPGLPPPPYLEGTFRGAALLSGQDKGGGGSSQSLQPREDHDKGSLSWVPAAVMLGSAVTWVCASSKRTRHLCIRNMKLPLSPEGDL